MARKPIHPSVTAERVMEMVERHNSSLDNPGICFGCGEEADSVEPDARRYTCESCGEARVYGAEEALMMIAF
jgi:hypothetical protein